MGLGTERAHHLRLQAKAGWEAGNTLPPCWHLWLESPWVAIRTDEHTALNMGEGSRP